MALPIQASSIITIENEVHLVDRWNNKIRDISNYVTAADFDVDIDRDGSKVSASVTSYEEVFEDGDWLSIFQRITPEHGDVEYNQRGHIRVDTPSVEMDARGVNRTIGGGGDIVGELGEVVLDRTFHTPKGGNIMEDVRYLIKTGLMGMIGANLVENGSFENGLASWSTSQTQNGSHGAGTSASNPDPAPSGSSYLYETFNSNAPVGSTLSLISSTMDVLPVWIGNQNAWASATVRKAPNHNYIFYVRFTRQDGSIIYPSGSGLEYYQSPVRANGAYQRIFFWMKGIPSDAVSMRVVAGAVVETVSTGSSTTVIDEVFLGTCVGTPLPDSRIRLPDSSRKASKIITHKAGTSVLTAINERLAAIGHHALYTLMDGTITTKPIRNIASDPPARVYESSSDIRFSDVISVERSAQNRYNRVIAVKESMEEGVDPMVAIAENSVSSDPWSIYQSPQKSITVMGQDAETIDDLQALADEKLKEAMEQEEIRFRITPDTTIAVHDIIQINGFEDERAVGRWGIKSIRYGINDYDPTMEIVARRIKKAVSSG